MSSKLKIPEVVKERFRFGTLSFIFILAYINVFQFIFGPENSIAGVIFAILMSASMVRDLTATPFRHLITQTFVLVWLALAAYWVNVLSSPLSFIINFVTLLVILYAFTYEYSSHLYFPYILSYLFLVFLSPVTASRLPVRLLAMAAGAVSIMLYQWFMGRNRVMETARDVLSEMIGTVCAYITHRIENTGELPDLSGMRGLLYRLSRTVYDRRRRILCVSDASFNMIDAGRGLEHLLILVHELPEQLTERDITFLRSISGQLMVFRSFLHQEITSLPTLASSDFCELEDEKAARLFFDSLNYIRDRLEHMTDPEKKSRYRPTALSLKVRLQAALDLSPVRAVYALRVALLLSCATSLVQFMGFPHGKWLLFTLASVSLPYADDVPQKMSKRIKATVTGGLVSFVIYSLIPSPAGRTAAMMLSGYVSFYLNDYSETFACSTVGALGGAVFMNAFGFQAVGSIVIIRLGYILAGAAAAYIVNCLICPYSRARATSQLLEKYKAVTELLVNVCSLEHVDTQLYYHLIIQAHLQEDKLFQNARMEKWTHIPDILLTCREQVRQAHRMRIEDRADAPVFEPEHLI